MGRKRKHPAISVHQTILGTLEVDWEQEYKGEFTCPHCYVAKLTSFYLARSTVCKLTFVCENCYKVTALTNQIPGAGRKHFPISEHETLNGTLKVNWKLEYKEEFGCPHCNQGQLTKYRYISELTSKLDLFCDSCDKQIYLTCRVPVYIYNYRPKIECPNPICTDRGHNGQKGWVYFYSAKDNIHQCRFCQTCFNPESKYRNSWIGSQREENLLPFVFDEDIWQLGYFYEDQRRKMLNFQAIYPAWYRQEVKKYIHYLLKSKVYASSESIIRKTYTLKYFGKILASINTGSLNEIKRSAIIYFLDTCKNNRNKTINSKLANLKNFFDWHNLETTSLIRSRDFLKVNRNDADWLDEVTRQGIKQHLDKIPAPVARHYLVQAYLAARPGDVCRLSFHCLVEENSKWYIKFFQQKTQRWHRILASRKIRKVIEQQQRWIRETFGEEYDYLFCHFRTIRQASYPIFSKIKPLPQPPYIDTQKNPMVRIIRMLIDRENILDANGRKPHFLGKITRHSRLQEVRTKYGIEAAQLYADHKSSATTFQHYATPTQEQIAEVDLPFQELLLNPENKFLPWQSLPESLLQNPKAHELDLEIAPRLVVYGHCALDPKTPCPVNLFPKCYGCSSFCPSTSKLPLYERQYQGEQQRLAEAEKLGAQLAQEEAKATIEAMDKWLPELRRLANG